MFVNFLKLLLQPFLKDQNGFKSLATAATCFASALGFLCLGFQFKAQGLGSCVTGCRVEAF